MANTILNDLTVFVISCGEETLPACISSLENQDSTFTIQQINDITPMSAAFQAMPDRCQTPYFLQVDADMLLEPSAVQSLYLATRASPFWVYRVSASLFEEGFGVGGAVKCWKKFFFRFTRFHDVRTVDRDLHRRMRRFGLTTQHQQQVVGIHRPRHSIFSLYLKTKSDVEKWRFLRRDVSMYAIPLVKQILSEDSFHPHRLLGAMLGALTQRQRLARSKDFTYERVLYSNLQSFFDRTQLETISKSKVNESFFSHFVNAYADFDGEQQSRIELAQLVVNLVGVEGTTPARNGADLLQLIE